MTEALPQLEVPTPECPAVLLPTPANLTNMFGDIATLAEKMALSTVEEWKAEGEKIKDILESARTFFAPYDPKFKRLEMVEKEWEIMIQRLIEEYPMYIQTEILSLINTLFPISFTMPLLGIQIDLLKLVTDRAYLNELMEDVQGYGDDVQAQIDALSSEDLSADDNASEDLSADDNASEDLSPDELQAQIDKLRGDKLDAIYAMLPDEYKLFSGEYGFEAADFKGKQIADFIKNEATKFMNNLMFAGFTGLIETFQTIWDALGLPALPGKETMNAGELIKAVVTAEKEKMATQLEALGDDPGQAAEDALKKEMDAGIVEGLKGIEIFGFDVMSLLGGEFTDNVESLEIQIARIQTKLKEFEANWQLFLLKTWMQKITAFLNAIGLGPIVELITLDFCDFMKLMGIPIPVIDLTSLSGIIAVVGVLNPDLKILDTLSAADNAFEFSPPGGSNIVFSEGNVVFSEDGDPVVENDFKQITLLDSLGIPLRDINDVILTTANINFTADQINTKLGSI